MITDLDLIERFLAGDRLSFDELVIRHQKRVYAAAYRMVGNAETAEEVVQDTFIRAFKSLQSFRRKSSFSTWLYRIAMNLCYNELKRRYREVGLNPEMNAAVADAPDGKMVEQERKKWLERQIELLPFKQKSALILRIYEELPFKEIGRAIGCSTGSAKVNYRHAILKLKAALAHSGEEL